MEKFVCPLIIYVPESLENGEIDFIKWSYILNVGKYSSRAFKELTHANYCNN
jgi:hypothetical protein